jgi:nucleoside 2-deoxyribosyltransferase
MPPIWGHTYQKRKDFFMKYDIYLAAPFFTEKEIEIYDRVVHLLRSMKLKVFVPREHEIPNAWELSNQEWAKQVFCADVVALSYSEKVVALNFGMYSDSGTAWEMGYALSLGTPVTQVLCGGENAVYSLMTINSAHNVCDLGNFSVEHTTVDISKIIQK